MSEATPSTGPKKPATAGQVKALVRRKLRKHPVHEEQSLNIYPMMDMMTILLVFMVMQFASASAIEVQDSDELRLPFSISTQHLEEAVPIQVTRNAILVDNVRMIGLRQGRIESENLQGGANSPLIPVLKRRLCEIRDQKRHIAQLDPNQPFGGEALIVSDRRTPCRTIISVLYTLGQCEFKTVRVLVGGSQGGGQ